MVRENFSRNQKSVRSNSQNRMTPNYIWLFNSTPLFGLLSEIFSLTRKILTILPEILSPNIPRKTWKLTGPFPSASISSICLSGMARPENEPKYWLGSLYAALYQYIPNFITQKNVMAEKTLFCYWYQCSDKFFQQRLFSVSCYCTRVWLIRNAR